MAREFWNGTGLGSVFPRNIEKVVALRLPLALVKLPRVTVPVIRRWLEDRCLRARVPNDQRNLMGCLVAYCGHGIAFIAKILGRGRSGDWQNSDDLHCFVAVFR